MYLGFAKRLGGPILEAACGSGRLLLPLARAGYEVVGLDSSDAMLVLARAKLTLEPEVANRVQLVCGDMRTAKLGQRFNLAIVALDSFGLMTTQRDQLRALVTLRRHLSPKGALVLDLANGNLRGGEPEEETRLHQSRRDAERGVEIVEWVFRRADHARQVDRLLHLYDETVADGTVRRTSVELELRYFTRFELELLLERSGYVLEALFGDYDLAPYGPHSERLIALAHAAEPRRQTTDDGPLTIDDGRSTRDDRRRTIDEGR
jgi:SAM-dependent methyltransferase